MGSPPSKRNYRKEYDSFHAKPEQKKNRAARNKARRDAKASGKNVVGKDVGHVKALKHGHSTKTKVQSVRSNRSHGGKISSGTKGKKLRR